MTNKQELEQAVNEMRELRERILRDVDEKLDEKFKELEKLAAKPEMKGWRQKPERGEEFYYIEADGITVKKAVWQDMNRCGEICADLYKAGNCFPCALFTEEQVQRVAWQNQLNSLLAQYAVVNGALASREEIEDYDKLLWWVEEFEGEPELESLYSQYSPVVKFNNEDIARQAIEDVVEPFLAEHPEFVW